MVGFRLKEYKNGNILFRASKGIVRDYFDLENKIRSAPGFLRLYIDDNAIVWLVNPFRGFVYKVGTKEDVDYGFCPLLSDLRAGISHRIRPYKGSDIPSI